jgi:glucan biosynthesis protein C
MAAINEIVRPEASVHHPHADNLRTLLVVGVIVGHATMAWTGIGNWVFTEPQVGEPVMSILSMFIIVAMFGMAVFFFIAGMFTPRSLTRKGPRKFLVDRTIRLGLPMLFFIVVMSPVIEYVDTDNAGWEQGFWAFTRHIWWPPAPGPTWFLGVLLLFSAVYAVVRTIRPVFPARLPLRARQLLIPIAGTAVASYAIRIVVPLGRSNGVLPWVRRRAGWPASPWASLRQSAAGFRSSRGFPGRPGGRPA